MPAALLGLLSFGLGLGWLQTRRLLDEISAHWVHLPHDAGQGGGAEALDLARHAALLAFASGAVGMCALAFSLRTRVRCAPRSRAGRGSWLAGCCSRLRPPVLGSDGRTAGRRRRGVAWRGAFP